MEKSKTAKPGAGKKSQVPGSKAVVIAVVNQKGGVGKTTTAVNLAASLAHLESKVLLIDSDPQGNTTSGLGIEKGELKTTTYDLLTESRTTRETIHPSGVENLDLIPAHLDLSGAELELVSAISRESRLKNALHDHLPDYRYIVIDCPPSLGLLTVNALTAADFLLIPIQCEFYPLEGLTQLLKVVEIVQKHLNPGLSILGVLLTMFDPRLNLTQQVAQEVRNFFSDKVFETIIPRNVKLSEAPSFGRPVLLYDKSCRGSKAYFQLAREVLQRTEVK